MAVGTPTNPKLKAEILDKIRNHGVAVSTVAEATGVSTKSIYRWLRSGIVDKDRNLILENNRLRKENEQLYKMLGKATAELNRSKD
jgi:transposase-like protein